jgi:hypothetical protein
MQENNDAQHDPQILASLHDQAGSTGHSASGDSDSALTATEHEDWLRGLELLERGPRSPRFDQLRRMGIDMPAPETLSDRKLTVKLWGIIYALAAADAYLSYTDHLTDRELYEELWNNTLRNGSVVLPPGSGWACYLGLLDSGSEEDIELLLRFHMDDAERARWAKEFPSCRIPPREAKRACRDRILPRSPSEHSQWLSKLGEVSDMD